MALVEGGSRAELVVGFTRDPTGDYLFGKNVWLAQTFPLIRVTDLWRLAWQLSLNVPSWETQFAIRATDGTGQPTGPDLASTRVHSSPAKSRTYDKWRRADLPFGSQFSPGQYAMVCRMPETPGTIDQQASYRHIIPLYDDGNAYYSDDSGTSWHYLLSRSFMFQAWGWYPPPENTDTKVISNWAPMEWTTENVPDTYQVIVTTDIPVHLYMRYTCIKPRKHPIERYRRGLALPWNTYYCFVAWKEVEQDEEGDTLDHTYTFTDWEIGETRWFYFTGTKRIELTPSASPIFELTRPPLPPPPSGTILGEIDALEFDPVFGSTPTLLHIRDTIYLIAYRGDRNDGWLATISVNDEGLFDRVIDTHEYEPVQALVPSLIHVSAGIYAIAYSGTGRTGQVKTIHIADNGFIGAEIDTGTFDPGYNILDPIIVRVRGNVYAIFYAGPENDGWLKTITIGPTGNVGAVLSEWEFNPIFGMGPSPLQIAPNIWAFAYRGDALGGSGKIVTVRINDDGSIGPEISARSYMVSQSTSPCLFHVSDSIYGIATAGLDGDGFLHTLSIDAAGIIGPVIATLEYDIDSADDPTVVAVGDNIWAIAYGGPTGHGWLKTITIETDGTITGQVDEYEFDETRGWLSFMVHVTGNVYLVVYSGPDYDGWLKTIGIQTP